MVAWVGPWEGASIPLAFQSGLFDLFGVWDSLEARSLEDGRGSGAVRGFGALQRPERRRGPMAGGLNERLLRCRLALRRSAWLRSAAHHRGHPGQLSLLEQCEFKQGLSLRTQEAWRPSQLPGTPRDSRTEEEPPHGLWEAALPLCSLVSGNARGTSSSS